MSVALVLGAFSLVTGLANSADKKISSMVPNIFGWRYHRNVSIAFYAVMVLTFLFWSGVTLEFRGAVFYSLHGRLALITILFALAGIFTGLGMARSPGRYRYWHWVTNLTTFSLFVITVVLGILRAI
jgi:hypothetical protein